MPHILVVENDSLALDCSIDLLEAENFQVTGVTDGASAKEIVTQEKFDLIVCELILPHVSGYEFFSYLRNQKNTEDIPFIVLTGKSRIQDINFGWEMGVDDYLTKPCSNRELIKSINTQLEKKQFLEKCYQAETPILRETSFADNTVRPDRPSLIDSFNQIVSQYVTERIESYSENSANKSQIAVCCLRLDFTESIIANSPQHIAELQIVAAQKLLGSIGSRANILCLPNGDLAIFLPYIKNLHQAIEIVRIGQDDLLEPSISGSTIINLKSHVGISFDPDCEGDIKTLLNRAQQLVAEAQTSQKDCYEVYSSNPLEASDIKSLALIEELHDCILSENHLSTDYQPQVDLLTGKVIGYEALWTWCHPQGGNIPLEIFAPIVEEAGSIESIETKFLFDECERLKNWHRQGFEGLKLEINISSSQFHRSGFTAIVQQVLREVRLKPQFLTLQLTPSTLLKNPKNAIACLGELKSLGVGVALKHFARGHYSLSYLRQFPFTTLKVDISYLHSLVKTYDSQVALKNLTKIARLLERQLIIEGVETKPQFDFLRRYHFAPAAGNYLSPPLKIDGFEDLLSGKSEWLTTLFGYPPI